MKSILNTIKHWAIFGVSALIILCGWLYVFLKARQTTNPLLSDTNPWALYVNTNETLTAAKWNTLVGNMAWIKIKIYTGTTAAADSTTFVHGLDWDKILSLQCEVKYSGTTYYPLTYYLYDWSQNARITVFNATNVTINHVNATGYRSQPYRCVVMYTD